MGPRSEIPHAFERLVAPACAPPAPPGETDPEARLEIAVVFTSADATLVALRRAGALASTLNARILLFVFQIVPFPLPLDRPPVMVDFNERRFHQIAEASALETVVRIYLCRDRQVALGTVLSAHSLVIVGGRKRWWPTAEARLARKLRQDGHEVIFAETK